MVGHAWPVRTAIFRMRPLLLLLAKLAFLTLLVSPVFSLKDSTVNEQDVPLELQDVLEKGRDEDGVFNLDYLLQAYVLDPLPVPDFNLSSATDFSSVQGRFWDVRLRGLSGVHVESIAVNLGEMNATTLVFIPILRLDGSYTLDGTVTLFSVNGGGNFWMNITDITMRIQGTLDPVDMSRVALEAEQRGVRLYFANLGGDLSSLHNAFLNQLGNAIFNQIKPHLLAALKENLKEALDAQVMRLPASLRSNASISLFDAALEQAGLQMKNNSLDPLPLRDHTEKFFQQMLFLSVHGEASIRDGQLHGLSTIHRTGPVEITYRNNQAILLEANLGFSNLSGGYDWSAHLMGVGPAGFASVSVRAISAFLQLEQRLDEPDSKPRISALRIERIRQIWVDVNGLGTWDFVLEILVNLVTNSIKMSLAQTIAEPVKQTVQRELDNVPLTLL